ncbi:MAG TPA: GIY-YIG nuclease family protein [Gammaproteobacteria bacterium]
MTRRPPAGAAEAPWHVYIARCADGSLYTGVARDLEARIAAHNAGRGAKYTRTRLPVVLVYREPAPDRGAALRRENEIRRLPADRKRRLVADHTSARSIKTI